jgi:hypothetical protein
MGDAIRNGMIDGLVQSVGYRAWVEREAMARGRPRGRPYRLWNRARRAGHLSAVQAVPLVLICSIVSQTSTFAVGDDSENGGVRVDLFDYKLRKSRSLRHS